MATPEKSSSPKQLQAMLDGPAGVPPSGVLPDFENPANLDAFLVLTLTFALSFGTLCVVVRTYTKLFIMRFFKYEDCMCCAWLSSLIC